MYAVIHHLILFIHNFIFGLDLKKLASELTPKTCLDLSLGPRALALAWRFWPRLTSRVKIFYN